MTSIVFFHDHKEQFPLKHCRHRGRTLAVRASLSILLCGFALSTSNAQPRNILATALSQFDIKNVLLSQKRWHPFPKASERELWEKLPPALKQQYIKRGEAALTYTWPSSMASVYLDYARTGNRQNNERVPSERRQKVLDLVLAECVEGKGRFIDQIVSGVWLLCEETSWVGPAHIAEQKAGSGLPDKSEPIIDLVSAETGNLLAWTYYLVGDQLDTVSPLIPRRIKSEIMERILKPGLERDDFWWMWTPGQVHATHHINNWTPWISSNWLAAALILEDRDEVRATTVSKIIKVLDRFLNFYPDDGGCDEGPSYWGHAGGSLFENLELLSIATNDRIDVYKNPLIQEMGRYIQRAHIADSYYMNFGDAPAKINIQAELVLRYGLKIHDQNLAGLGATAAEQQKIMESGISGSLTRQLLFLFNLDLLKEQSAKETLLKDVWLPQSEVMVARQAQNSTKGFTLAAQGGHNEQSHNHNDVGSFMLYADGEPVLVDVGVEAYTAKTFSSERYDIWTMQSAYHNLPTVNGYMQSAGKQSAARDVQYQSWQDSVSFSLDIARAYPAAAKISKWNRTFHFDRKNGTMNLADEYQLDTDAKDIALSLMTPCQVIRSESDHLVLRVNTKQPQQPFVDIVIRFEGGKLIPQVETIPLQDNRLRRIWGDNLQRIILKVKSPKQHDGYTVTFSKKAE